MGSPWSQRGAFQGRFESFLREKVEMKGYDLWNRTCANVRTCKREIYAGREECEEGEVGGGDGIEFVSIGDIFESFLSGLRNEIFIVNST